MNLHAQMFGKAVRMMQEDLGLSTEQLAEQAGLCPHLLARIENGTAKGDEWGLREICGLASGMGVTPNRLIAKLEQLIEAAGEAWW